MQIAARSVAVGVLSLLSACFLANSGADKKIGEAVHNLNDQARWGRINDAALLAMPDYRETFLRQQRAIMARPDSRPTLSDIRVPTLVIRGAQDGITTDAHFAEIAGAVPGARAEVLADQWREFLAAFDALRQPDDIDRARATLRPQIEAFQKLSAELDRVDPAGAERRAAEAKPVLARLQDVLRPPPARPSHLLREER